MAEGGGGGLKKTLRSGKMTEEMPAVKERAKLKKPQRATRSTTTFWLIGEAENLKFWSDTRDVEGNLIPACPDMTGKQLPTVMEAMRHMAYLRLNDHPKAPVFELALETCSTISVYWNMAKIPIQEVSDRKHKMYRAADKLSNLWQEYQVLKHTLFHN